MLSPRWLDFCSLLAPSKALCKNLAVWDYPFAPSISFMSVKGACEFELQEKGGSARGKGLNLNIPFSQVVAHSPVAKVLLISL